MHPALSRLNDKTLLQSDTYIDGAWVGGGNRFAVTDPATGVEIAQVPNLDAAAAEQAIAAAHAAWPAWRAKTGKERAAVLRRWYDLIMAAADDLAAIMTAEQGKPLAEARGEVMYGASFIEWFAEEAKRVNGDVLASPSGDKKMLVLKQAIGVCASMQSSRSLSARSCAIARWCAICPSPDRRR